MGQQTRWEKTNKDKRNLLRHAKVGMTFYGTVEQSKLGRRAMAPRYMCDRWTVTHMHPIFGGAMVGSSSLESILFSYGPLFTTPIDSLHPIWEPLPQASGPFDDQPFDRILDADEIRGLEKLAKEARELRGKAKTKRSWL